jgi:hypothetical protein
MNKEYNGHKNWDYWNVHLWLTTEEPAYRTMVRFSRYVDGAHLMLLWLGGRGAKTPDGARYSIANIKEAMKNLDS